MRRENGQKPIRSPFPCASFYYSNNYGICQQYAIRLEPCGRHTHTHFRVLIKDTRNQFKNNEKEKKLGWKRETCNSHNDKQSIFRELIRYGKRPFSKSRGHFFQGGSIYESINFPSPVPPLWADTNDSSSATFYIFRDAISLTQVHRVQKNSIHKI